jgi:protein TonB
VQPPSHRFRRLLPLLGGVAIVAIVVAGLIWLIDDMQQEKEQPKRPVAQVIKLIRPPPPPPEPPPPPPPPEEKIEEPLPQETPEEAPPDEAAPAEEQLGLDADGVAGADGFGLAARKGGRDLLGSGGAAFAWYTTMLKDHIQETLSDDERIRRGKYQVTVSVWLRPDGTIEQIKLRSTSGDRSLDQAIEERLQRMQRPREAPPPEMPQPFTFRMVSR